MPVGELAQGCVPKQAQRVHGKSLVGAWADGLASGGAVTKFTRIEARPQVCQSTMRKATYADVVSICIHIYIYMCVCVFPLFR